MRQDMINHSFGKTALAVGVAASLLSGSMTASLADTRAKVAPKLTEDQKITHILNRLGYGPRPGDIERVKRIGTDKYIDQQLHPERIDDSTTEARLADLSSLRMNIAEIYDKYPAPQFLARELGLRPGQLNQQNKAGASEESAEAKENQREMRQKIFAYYAEHGLRPPNTLLQELQTQKVIRAAYSERQLQEVMTDFWFNHFNVFWAKGADKWLTTDFEMNAIRPHTMGKFKDLLMATAKSPAILFYLDNFQSSSPDVKTAGGREMIRRGELRKNRGLLGGLGNPQYEMRQRQRDQLDEQMQRDERVTGSQRQPQIANSLKNRKRGINENYARELMELHTLGVDGGYTQKDVQEVARCFTGWTIDQPRLSGKFVFRQFMHDDKEKMVLGHKIPAGGGIKDGEMVIDTLVHHPSTARFISTKLVRKFVSDKPPKSLVERVAAAYTRTDGDIREMLRAIFTSPEFNSAEAYRAKIKSPFELAVSAIRALGGETRGSPRLAQFIARMGEPLYQYQPPTGYPDRAEQWVNTGALLERLNFGLAISSNRIPGTTVDLVKVTSGLDSSQTDRIIDRATAVLLGGDITPQTRTVLQRQLKEGVPVKGELTEGPPAMKRADAMDASDAMVGGNQMPSRPVGKAALQERREMRALGAQENSQVAQVQVDPRIAKVFGLVLGSPEFQRR